MDVMQRVEDLTNTALDERGNNNERFNAAVGALRLIRQYKLLGKKRIDVAVSILEKFTNPDFVEGVVTRAEKMVSGGERVMGSVKKMSDLLSRSRGEERVGKRGRRTYGGR